MLPTRTSQGVRVLESMAAIVHLGVIETHLGTRPWEYDGQFRHGLSDEKNKAYPAEHNQTVLDYAVAVALSEHNIEV